MITEETVRNAVRVANELVKWKTVPPDCYFAMWHSVYTALVYGRPPERCAMCSDNDEGEPS